MKKNWLIALMIIIIIAALYFIEFSKVKNENGNMPTLDNLQTDETSHNWDLFYKVRATINDGQSASFSIPDELKDLEGTVMKLSGAAVFFGNGSEMLNDSTASIRSFYLYPTLGLAQSCVLDPAEAMRWTIVVNLEKPWVLSRNEMVNAEVIVSGMFKIDTSKPYEAAFYFKNSTANIK